MEFFIITNRNRQARIDKKKISEAVYSLHDIQFDSDVDPRDPKSKILSKYEKDEKRTSARRSKVKQNINTEDSRLRTKLTRSWQPVKRIPATSNFVYEFNPFGNAESDDASKGPKDSQNSLNLYGSSKCSKASITSKCTVNIKKGTGKVKTRSIATLPKLSSNPNCTVNVLDRQGTSINLEGETTLPFIPKKRDMTKNEAILKESENRFKTTPAKMNEIDRDVENMKSNWQQYRKSHASNPRSRKLCDMLEKATREIDKIQKSVDLTSNRYLRKSTTKLSKDSETIAEGDIERIRNVLFPKRDSWTNPKSISTTGANSPRKDHEEEILKMGKKEIVKQRSLFTEKRLWSIDDVFDLESSMLLNRCDKNERNNEMIGETPVFNDKKSSKIKSGNVRKYLEDYIAKDDTFDMVPQNKVEGTNFEPSAEYVADTLAKLNFNTVESQNTIEEHRDGDMNNPYCMGDDEITQSCLTDDNGKSINETSNPCLSSIKNTESNTKFSGEIAHIETGINTLNLPKDILDQVLQSEYLKKDLLSLHPT